jgi:hypothetical protein
MEEPRYVIIPPCSTIPNRPDLWIPHRRGERRAAGPGWAGVKPGCRYGVRPGFVRRDANMSEVLPFVHEKEK